MNIFSKWREFASNLINRDWQRRRWGYGSLEIICITVFGLCSTVIFRDHGYPLGISDLGMARITASCLMGLSVVGFVLTVYVKKIDHE